MAVAGSMRVDCGAQHTREMVQASTQPTRMPASRNASRNQKLRGTRAWLWILES